MSDHPKQDLTYFDLKGYIDLLMEVPIVHKASVLYDDSPHEVSIRVEYLDNLTRLDPELIATGNNDMTIITTYARIKGYDRINITYVQKEVIV